MVFEYDFGIYNFHFYMVLSIFKTYNIRKTKKEKKVDLIWMNK